MSKKTQAPRILPEHTPEQRKAIIVRAHEVARQNIAKTMAARQGAPAIIAKAKETARRNIERAWVAIRSQSKPKS